MKATWRPETTQSLQAPFLDPPRTICELLGGDFHVVNLLAAMIEAYPCTQPVQAYLNIGSKAPTCNFDRPVYEAYASRRPTSLDLLV